MSLTAKKVDYIFKRLNSNITVDRPFSCVVNSWRKESQAEEIFNLNSRLKWGAQYPYTHRIHFIFLSTVAVMQVIFELKIMYALFLIAGFN